MKRLIISVCRLDKMNGVIRNVLEESDSKFIFTDLASKQKLLKALNNEKYYIRECNKDKNKGDTIQVFIFSKLPNYISLYKKLNKIKEEDTVTYIFVNYNTAKAVKEIIKGWEEVTWLK